MRFNLALIVASVVGAAQAFDFRELYTLPSGLDMVSFTVEFGNACATWAPALSAGLTFEGFNVEPGDFRGLNPDTEAKIDCVFTVGGDVHQPQPFTDGVATSLGATLTPDA
ncbi:hypothetical protein C8F01DRAFT_1079586 [Mycena amicta]|nr:hypothetical protein C8F01DRAFT_1079586 [Mycena amicta]